MYGCESWTTKKAECRKLKFLNCGVWKHSWESLGLQDQTSLCWGKSVLNNHWKDWCWSWSAKSLATWCEELTHWKRPWCWERLKAGEEGDDRERDGWMTSPTQWTWIWASSGSWWWREAWRAAVPGVAKSWTWLSNWTELNMLAVQRDSQEASPAPQFESIHS